MKSLVLLPILAAFCAQTATAAPVITLKDNDTWVMAGDSITAQRLHSNYIEAFFRTRYPQLKLHFRNSGIGGNKTSHILERFDYDVAAWKPTVVSIELGMNDVNGPLPDYVSGMKKLGENIRAIQAQPLFFSSSPVNDGSILNKWNSQRCQNIHPFTEALKEVGQQEKVPVIDQYHALIDRWGPNRIVEEASGLATRIRTFKPEDRIPEYDTLQAFAKLWEGKPSGVSLGGDAVHPGPVGQYMMAATILKGLDVDSEVSSASLKAGGQVVASAKCKITDVVARNGKLSFVRLDERTPWPVEATAMPSVLKLMPEFADLSRYMLTVSGLPAGQYRVTMDDQPVATLSNEDLAKGWNAGAVVEGPSGKRATEIIGLIGRLQNPLNTEWRAASKAKNAEQLAAAQKAIDECEAKLQAAVQPTPIRVSIEPVK